MSRSFETGIKGLTAELFAQAQAQTGRPSAPATLATDWSLKTDGAGLGVAAYAAPVTHYQGYGEAPALKR